MISTLTNLSWLTLLANNAIVIMFHAQASFNIVVGEIHFYHMNLEFKYY